MDQVGPGDQPQVRDRLGALPVAIDNMESDETMWMYCRGPVVIGFVLDRDGYISNITIAAEKCDYARTALWRPHQYIQLGDSFKRVLYRYGVPDSYETFDGRVAGEASPGTGIIQVTVTTGGGAAGAAGGGPGMGPGGGAMGGPGGPGGPGMGAISPMGGQGLIGPPGGMGMAGPGAGMGGAGAAGTTMVYSRDCILRYEEDNNITFTLHNMKVTRIHIWR